MTLMAKGNQILQRGSALMAAESTVVDFETRQCTASLAAPSISFEDLQSNLLVFL